MTLILELVVYFHPDYDYKYAREHNESRTPDISNQTNSRADEVRRSQRLQIESRLTPGRESRASAAQREFGETRETTEVRHRPIGEITPSREDRDAGYDKLI